MAFRPVPVFEVNFEDDPLQPHPAYLNSLAPIGFWRMHAPSGSTEEDQTTNNRDLTYVNAPTLGAAGAFTASYDDLDTAVSFNGSDEYAATASSSAWQNLTSAWTLAAWIYPTASRSGSNGGSSIITAGYAGSGNTIPFVLQYGAFGFSSIGDVVWAGWRHSDNVHRFTKDTASPTLNAWAHYVATWDGTTITLYKNGVPVGSPTVPGVTIPAASGTVPLRVGFNDVAAAEAYFPGRVDEVAVWDSALSEVQIANLYRYHTIRPVTEGNYVDLSDRLREQITVRRGRSDAVSRIPASTGTVILDNDDGALLPDPVVNRAVNPTGEIDELGLPFSEQDGTLDRDAGHVRTGTYAWKLTTTTAAAAYATMERDGLVGMQPGEQITASIYVYVETAGDVDLADVTLEIVDVAGGSETVTSSGNPAALDAFGRISVTRTVPANATKAYARVKLISDGVAGRYIHFDDFQVEEASSASTYCDGDQTDCRWGGEPHRSLSHRAAYTNAISNGDFQADTTGWSTSGTNTIAASSDVSQYGSRSLKATYQDNSNLAFGGPSLTVGQTYSFDAWVYIPTSWTGGNIHIENNYAAGALSAANMATRDQWQQVTGSATVTTGAGNLNLKISGGATSTAGQFIYMDGVRLYASTAAPWRKIIPMRRFRLSCDWDSVSYPLLQGYVEAFSYTFPGSLFTAFCELRLTDGTRVLASQSMRGFTRSSERVGDRIRAILAYAGIPNSDVDVDDEQIDTLALRAESVTDDTTPVALINEIEETEGGVFFFSRDGKFTYQGSLFRSIEDPVEFSLTGNDTVSADIPYSELAAHVDVAAIANQTTLENVQNASTTVEVEPASQARYFPVAASYSSQWQTNTVSYVDRSVPMPYADGVEVFAENDPDRLWPMILPLELGALGRIERLQAARDLWQGYLHDLEGIQYTIPAKAAWGIQLLTVPKLVAPVTADPWQTPITKPVLFTSANAAGGSSITLPSKTYVAGRLYTIHANLWASGGTAPVAPTFTSGNTWSSIRADTGVSSASWRHQTFSTVVGGSNVTEALQLTFSGQTPNALYDVVVVEIAAGFQAGTPIGDSNQHTTVSAYAGYIDVGTLTDTRSIVLGGFWKDAEAAANWSGAVSLYNRQGPFTDAYSVAYGSVPGVDRIDISWGQANGYHGTGFEVEAA